MSIQTNRERARLLALQIGRFDHQSKRLDYTDTDEAWTLLRRAHALLLAVADTDEQGRDSADRGERDALGVR